MTIAGHLFFVPLQHQIRRPVHPDATMVHPDDAVAELRK
jgi:hypothetical protein